MVAFINERHDSVEYMDPAALLDGVKECSEGGAVRSEQLGEYRRLIRQASLMVAVGECDVAALLLDGMAQRLALAWFAGHGLIAPDPLSLLAHLEERQSALAWWLRLALRAPDIEARLVHCAQLLAEIDEG